LLGFVPFWRWQARFRSPNFCVSGLSKALQDFDADVIHIGPLPYCGLMYAGVEAAESGAKLVSTPCTHFGPAGSDFVSRHYTQPFQIQLLKCCNSVFTLTRLETERLEALGIEGRRLIHSGIGIEPESVTGGNSAALRERYGISGPLVLQLGMKAPEKGTLATFQAMQILWDKGVNVTLVLAGRSLISVEQWLKGQAAPAGKFLNLGAIDETQKRDLLSAADVLVQPSAVESFGLTTLEAWANAKPVIAADLPVSREIITEGQDGLIVPFGNSDALAQAIEWLISAPQKSRAMGERGRKKLIRNYNGAAVIQRLISHIIEDSSN
jgi:glycosyltransferase involved in cell wall biosynthesis